MKKMERERKGMDRFVAGQIGASTTTTTTRGNLLFRSTQVERRQREREREKRPRQDRYVCGCPATCLKLIDTFEKFAVKILQVASKAASRKQKGKQESMDVALVAE